MLTIAFTSYQGSVCKWWANDSLNKIPCYENSIELLSHKAYPTTESLYLNFVPLRNNGIDINSSALGYTNIKGNWPQCFDAMIYLKEQRPPTVIK